jgi:hypothetical protein
MATENNFIETNHEECTNMEETRAFFRQKGGKLTRKPGMAWENLQIHGE